MNVAMLSETEAYDNRQCPEMGVVPPDLWKSLFLTTHDKRHHFLHALIESAFDSICKGDFNQLSGLLNQNVVNRLKSFVLLTGLNYCHSCNEAVQLVKTIHSIQDESEDELITQACHKLTYQVELVKWCLENAKSLVLASGASLSDLECATEMFRGLEIHSPLYVLYTFTKLSSLDTQAVIDILNKCPAISRVDGKFTSFMNQDKTKHVTFKDCQPDSSLSTNTGANHDISVYMAFITLQLFTQSLYCASEFDTMLKEKSENIQYFYSENVWKRLLKGQHYLNQLHPLTLRLEILENIFSLLFTTAADTVTFDLESDNTDTDCPSGIYKDVASAERPDQDEEQNHSELSEQKETSTEKDGSAAIEVNNRASTFSNTSSSSSLHKTGFIVNQYFVRDLLHILNESLVELESGMFSRQKEDGGMPEGISKDDMTSRLSRLSSYVREACWRSPLVCENSWVTRPGYIPVISTDLVDANDDIDSYLEWELHSTVNNAAPKMKKTLQDKIRRRSFRDSDITDSGTSGRRRSKRRHSQAVRHSALSNSRLSVIGRMLAPTSSLLNLCLMKGNLAKAKNLLTLLNTNAAEKSEVEFADLYSNAKNQLMSNTQASVTTAHVSINAGKASMKNIGNIAAVGRAAMATTTVVDELLTSNKTPTFPDHVLSFAHAHRDYALTLHEPFIPSMIITDLACSSCLASDSSSSLINLANARLNMDLEEKTDSDSHIRSFPTFLRQIHSIVLGLNELANTILKHVNKGATAVLTCVDQPLNAERINQYGNFLSGVDKASTTAIEALKERKAGKSHDSTRSTVKGSKTLNSAMKQLIRVLSDTTFAILDYFNGNSDSVNRRYRNYLTAVYEHVKILLAIMLEPESKTKPDDDYFHILDDMPTTLLGKVLFERKVSPYKLEKVAQRLKVDLVQICVNSCCSPIGCKLLEPWQMKPGHVKDGKFVLNHCDNAATLIEKRPDLLVAEVLTKVLQIIKKSSANSHMITSDKFDVVSTNTDVRDILNQLQGLRRCDVTTLSTNQRTAFYCNLTNLLNIHANMIVRINGKGNTSLTRLKQYAMFGYQVGKLGILTQFDLRHLLIGVQPSASIHRLAQFRTQKLSIDDVWYEMTPAPEPRMIFLLMDGYVSSPPVQVVSADILSQQLQTATTSYLANNVIIDEDNNHVDIPELLLWHRPDFRGDHETMLTYISDNLDGEQRNALGSLLTDSSDELENVDEHGEKDLPRTTIEAFSYEFGYRFSYDCRKTQTSTKTHRRGISLPTNLEGASFTDKTEGRILTRLDSENDSSPDRTLYNLRAVTLEYVKQHSPLVATLVSLVCSDDLDDIEENFTDNHYDNDKPRVSRHMSESDITLINVRSYRYQRLKTDFHHLQKFIIEHILPLSHSNLMTLSDPVLKLVSNTIDDELRQILLVTDRTNAFKEFTMAALNKHLDNNNWNGIVALVNSLPERLIEENAVMPWIRDWALSCAAFDVSRLPKLVQNHNQWRYVTQMTGVADMVRVVLGSLEKWKEGVCVHLLEVCALMPGLDDDLRTAIKSALTRMNVYSTIVTCAGKLSQGVELPNPRILHDLRTDWRTVSELSKTDPHDIMLILLDSRQFAVARDWAKIHDIGLPYRQLIEESYMKYLFDRDQAKSIDAYLEYESFLYDNEEFCLNVCGRILQLSPKEETTLFVSRFMLTHLRHHLDTDNREQLHLLCTGAKILMALPETMRSDYSDLIASPMLILEQLLMNMQTDLARKTITIIKSDIALASPDTHHIDVNLLDNLVITYATKALEFPVVELVSMAETANASLSSAVMSLTGNDGFNRLPGSLPRDESPRVGFSIGSGTFIMPPNPVPREEWVPDVAVHICMCCQVERFSMFNRRHHCRRCGRVVCAACSAKTTVIDSQSARTCDDCYNQIYRKDEPLQSSQRLSGSPLLIKGESDEMDCTNSSMVQNYITSFLPTEYSWKLTIDESKNQEIRRDFYFEHAPSTSLCLSVMELHGNPRECGCQMLQFCDELSRLLKSVVPGGTTQEVDYNLVIGMMKYLLFNAKLKFMTCGDTEGIARCDQYQSRVDLMNLLLSNNCRGIPSIQQLTKLDTVRRLRDQLIEEERLPLAMEVSTKCGLDTNGVWASWGIACLNCGNLQQARTMFSRCLKAPVDRNQMSSGSQKLLNDIVECLETVHLPSGTGTSYHLPVRSTEDVPLDEDNLKECLFYLETYGGYLPTVNFYRRHGFWQKACKFILDNKCSSDVFIEGLLVPAIKTSELGQLQDQLLIIDPSLNSWQHYLTASCRYLQSNNYYNVLYCIQVFMKDYIRAAMSCITVQYPRNAKTYSELVSRTRYLLTARQHLEMYLQTTEHMTVPHFTQSPSSPTPASWNTKTHKSDKAERMQPKAVHKHIRTINLQMDIAKLLAKAGVTAETDVDGAGKSMADDPKGGATSDTRKRLPTLFGNSKERSEVAVLVMQSGPEDDESFTLGCTIIKEYKLSASLIFTQVVRRLAKDAQYTVIQNFLGNVEDSGLCDDQSHDEIIGSCVRIIVNNPQDSKIAESLIKLIKLDSNKMNAYILCGKLKQAYLIAIRKGNIEDVQIISGAAQRAGQTAVKDICDRFLAQHQRGSTK